MKLRVVGLFILTEPSPCPEWKGDKGYVISALSVSKVPLPKELVDNLTMMVGGQKGKKEYIREKAGNSSPAQELSPSLLHSLNYLKTKGKIRQISESDISFVSQTV